MLSYIFLIISFCQAKIQTIRLMSGFFAGQFLKNIIIKFSASVIYFGKLFSAFIIQYKKRVFITI